MADMSQVGNFPVITSPDTSEFHLTDVTSPAGKTRIVVVGSGFGGTSFISRLNRKLNKRLRQSTELILVSGRNYHLFTPLLYQVATGMVDSHHILEPVWAEAARRNFVMLVEKAESVDLPNKTIQTLSLRLHFDYLVLATGSASNDFGIPGVREFATPLKTVPDGEKMRNRILDSLHSALALDRGDPARARKLRFVIVGGGATGVELSASIRDYIDDIISYSGIEQTQDLQVTLIEALDRLMPEENIRFSDKCKRMLEARRIRVRLNSKVRKVTEIGIEFDDGSEIQAENIFWTAGIKPVPFVEGLAFPPVTKKKGWIVVNEHLAINSSEDSFAIGDACTFIDHEGKSVPKNAVAAVEEGDYLARLIAARLGGKSYPRPFSFRDKGTMLALGKHSGIARFRSGIVITGFWAWFLWRAVHLLRITTVRNKIGVLFDWSFSAFHRRIMIQTD